MKKPDELAEALERAARLQEENDRLHAELAAARRAQTAPPLPSAPLAAKSSVPALAFVLVGAGVGAVVGAAAFRAAPVAAGPSPTAIPASALAYPVTSVAPPPEQATLPMRMPVVIMRAAVDRPVASAGQRIVEARSNPIGAFIEVDGKSVGTTPAYLIMPAGASSHELVLNDGRQRVRVSLDGGDLVGHDFSASGPR